MYESLEAQAQGAQLEATEHLEMVQFLYAREELGLSTARRGRCTLICGETGSGRFM